MPLAHTRAVFLILEQLLYPSLPWHLTDIDSVLYTDPPAKRQYLLFPTCHSISLMLCGHRPSRCQSRQPPRGRIRRAVLGPWCTSLTVASPSLCPSQPGCLALLRRCGHPDLEVGFLCCLTPLPGLLVPRVPVSSLAVLLALGSLATSPVVACAGGPAPGLPYTAWFSLFLSVSDTHCVIS